MFLNFCLVLKIISHRNCSLQYLYSRRSSKARVSMWTKRTLEADTQGGRYINAAIDVQVLLSFLTFPSCASVWCQRRRLSVLMFKFGLRGCIFLLATLFHRFPRFSQCEGHSSIKPAVPTLSLGWDFFFPTTNNAAQEEVQERRLTETENRKLSLGNFGLEVACKMGIVCRTGKKKKPKATTS